VQSAKSNAQLRSRMKGSEVTWVVMALTA
jgi:hypothetical protein